MFVRTILLSFLIISFLLINNSSFGQGGWMPGPNLPAGPRSLAMGASVNDKGYLCGGVSVFAQSFLEQWEYDPGTMQWTAKAPMPSNATIGATQRQSGFACSANNKVYYGLGLCDYNSYGACGKYVFEYDPFTNSWAMKANFPGCNRWVFSSFVINNKIYVLTGSALGSCISGTYLADLWEFDPVANLWTQKASIPGGGRAAASAFALNGYGYIVGGYGIPSTNSEVWQYNPLMDSWTQKGNFPGGSTNGAATFVIGSFAYLLYHANGSFWKYDAATDNWSSQTNFPGPGRTMAVSFAALGKAYITTGQSFGGPYYNDLWEYNPDCPVNVPNTVSVSSQNTLFCSTSGLIDTIKADSILYGNTIYQWYYSTDSINYFPVINGNTPQLHNQTISQTTFYKRQVTLSPQCTHISVPVKITVIPFSPAVITPQSSLNFCLGDSAILLCTSPYKKMWVFNNQLLLPDTTQLIYATGAGQYSVIISNGPLCTDTASVTTQILAQPLPPVIQQSGNSLISSLASAYQWYLNDIFSPIPNATQQTYFPVSPGVYLVQITDGNGCKNISSDYTFVPTSIAGNAGKTNIITIHPNPTDGDFTITNTGSLPIEGVLQNIMLAKKITLLLKPGMNRIKLKEALAPGVYILRIADNSFSAYEKVIVE